MLYPLNALINSQRDRLIGWTRGFKGDVASLCITARLPTNLMQSRARRSSLGMGIRKALRVKVGKLLETLHHHWSLTQPCLVCWCAQSRPIIKPGQIALDYPDEAHTLIDRGRGDLVVVTKDHARVWGQAGGCQAGGNIRHDWRPK